MSDQNDKNKNSRRRHSDEVAIKKQIEIAKQHGLKLNDQIIREPHRLSKHHAMDCGNPECYICGNPRKTHKDKLTPQEKRIFQDTDHVRDKHSNGLKHDDEE